MKRTHAELVRVALPILGLVALAATRPAVGVSTTSDAAGAAEGSGLCAFLPALVRSTTGLSLPPSPGETGDASGESAEAPGAYSEGEEALEQIAAPFSALRTFQADFVQTQRWIGMDETVQYKGVLSIARPNRFRIEYTDPKGHLQVSDGTQVWTYVPENGQVLLLPLRDEQSRGDFLTRILEESQPAPRLERGTLDGKPVRILSLTPPEGLELDHVRLWTEEGSSAILQYELTERGGNQTTYRLEKIRENPELDERLFHFEPPPGVPVVEVGAP